MPRNTYSEKKANYPEFKQGYPEFKTGSQLGEYGNNAEQRGFGGGGGMDINDAILSADALFYLVTTDGMNYIKLEVL